MAKCKDCWHYKPINDEVGTCFGVEVKAKQNPKDCNRCRGKYFEPRPYLKGAILKRGD